MFHPSTFTNRRVGCLDCLRNSNPNSAFNMQTKVFRVSSQYSLFTNVVRYPRLVQTVGSVSERTEIAHFTKTDEDEKFDWFKNWWPVQVVENLPTDRPYRIQLLGKYYVVWQGHSGNWIAMDDECPHRLAPLSEGRIEKDGNLLCSYHAWRFNESGKCVKIPHAEDEKAHSVACNSHRSAVQTYPCKTRGALLWIWPDKSVTAFTESEKALLPMDDDLADSLERSSAEGSSVYIRYMPYSFDILMENLCDPSHAPISHHGVSPALNRYKAKPLNGKLVDGIGQRSATAAFRYSSMLPFFQWSQSEFRKPGAVSGYVGTKTGELAPTRLFFAATPVSSERSLLVNITTSLNTARQSSRLNPVQLFFNRMITLILHVKFQNDTFDGDSVFLHEQDKKIKRLGSNFNATKEYYFPTSADLLVMAFRKWFETEGDYGAAYAGIGHQLNGRELTREDMLDRYGQHTKHCKICREGLEMLESVIEFLKFLSLGAIFIGAMILIKGTGAELIELKFVLKNISFWSAFAIGMVSVLLQNYLEKKVRPLFFFKDWVHAEND